MRVRERLTKGESDKQALDVLVARYGEFVLLRPPLEWHTLLLWGLPPIALLTGMAGLIIMARKRKTVTLTPQALSDTEQRRLSTLVEPRAGDH